MSADIPCQETLGSRSPHCRTPTALGRDVKASRGDVVAFILEGSTRARLPHRRTEPPVAPPVSQQPGPRTRCCGPRLRTRRQAMRKLPPCAIPDQVTHPKACRRALLVPLLPQEKTGRPIGGSCTSLKEAARVVRDRYTIHLGIVGLLPPYTKPAPLVAGLGLPIHPFSFGTRRAQRPLPRNSPSSYPSVEQFCGERSTLAAPNVLHVFKNMHRRQGGYVYSAFGALVADATAWIRYRAR
jgi:hypothetical protein